MLSSQRLTTHGEYMKLFVLPEWRTNGFLASDKRPAAGEHFAAICCDQGPLSGNTHFLTYSKNANYTKAFNLSSFWWAFSSSSFDVGRSIVFFFCEYLPLAPKNLLFWENGWLDNSKNSLFNFSMDEMNLQLRKKTAFCKLWCNRTSILSQNSSMKCQIVWLLMRIR